jgi:surfeit locus 1 family protein
LDEQYNVNDKSKKPLPTWLPLVVGAFLVVQFLGLSSWQISRGLEKRSTQSAYHSETNFRDWRHGSDVRSFERLRVTGHYIADRQVILDNIIINSRYGHYVLTPIETAADEPLLLINRGWIERTDGTVSDATLALSGAELSVRGRAGSLPKAGYKMGDGIEVAQDWPKHAVYPSAEELEAALGRDIQAFVLLMDHQEQNGFLRHWVPSEFGPGKHFGYALQWFAMAAVLLGLLVWNYRKKRFDS